MMGLHLMLKIWRWNEDISARARDIGCGLHIADGLESPSEPEPERQAEEAGCRRQDYSINPRPHNQVNVKTVASRHFLVVSSIVVEVDSGSRP